MSGIGTDGQSEGEAAFAFALRTLGTDLPPFVQEYSIPEGNRFKEGKVNQPFRADFAWPEQKVLFEVQGRGHESSRKFMRDLDRHNLLTMWGYRVLYATPIQINDDPNRLIGVLRRLLLPKAEKEGFHE